MAASYLFYRFGSRRLIGRRRGRSAKVINDSKAAQRQLEELKRHNRIMEFISLRKHE